MKFDADLMLGICSFMGLGYSINFIACPQVYLKLDNANAADDDLVTALRGIGVGVLGLTGTSYLAIGASGEAQDIALKGMVITFVGYVINACHRLSLKSTSPVRKVDVASTALLCLGCVAALKK